MDMIAYIKSFGLEPDQRLHRAIIDASRFGATTDAKIFVSLLRLNVISSRYVEISRSHLISTSPEFYDPDTPPPDDINKSILKGIIESACSQAGSGHTIGARDFLIQALQTGHSRGDIFDHRPYTVDMLIEMAGLPNYTNLSDVPIVQQLISAILSTQTRCEDFEYFIAFEGNRIVFRAATVLDDYVQTSSSGLFLPQRALLTHFKSNFGGFTTDEIKELEELLNNPKAREADFQRFFERHPHFFRKWDYREVHPHIYLADNEAGNLIPDFILTDREMQKAALVELKLPSPTLVRRQRNRDRFAAAVSEARTQLLRYRDWFRVESNREHLKALIGMKIYEPHLSVIIGRSSVFLDEFDRQRLAADNPDIEVVTYDDILTFANRRRLILEDE